MENTIKVEIYIFLTAIYGGLIAGLVYDIYRVIRYFFKPKKIFTIIEDLLFWIGIATIFVYIINKSSWGQLRGYMFIGFFLGGLIYLKILSKILFPLWVNIFKGIDFIIKGICHIIKLPFKKGKRIISPKIKKINKLKRIPKEAINEIRRYKRIISKKK